VVSDQWFVVVIKPRPVVALKRRTVKSNGECGVENGEFEKQTMTADFADYTDGKEE
jgi:hypothetical protein